MIKRSKKSRTLFYCNVKSIFGIIRNFFKIHIDKYGGEIMRNISAFRKLNNFFGDVLLHLTGFATVIMIFLLAGNTFSRYLFNSPVSFAEEYTAYLVIIITFLPLAYTQRENGHIEVDVIVCRLPKKLRLILELFTSALTLLVSSLMIWHGAILAMKSFKNNVFSQTIMMTPLWIVQMIIVLGLVGFIFQELFVFCDKIIELREDALQSQHN